MPPPFQPPGKPPGKLPGKSPHKPDPVVWRVTWPKQVVKADGTTETYWVQLGTAFRYVPALNQKDKIEVRIDSIPLNWDGKLVLFLKDEDDY
jgi:hypothetical protein